MGCGKGRCATKPTLDVPSATEFLLQGRLTDLTASMQISNARPVRPVIGTVLVIRGCHVHGREAIIFVCEVGMLEESNIDFRMGLIAASLFGLVDAVNELEPNGAKWKIDRHATRDSPIN